MILKTLSNSTMYQIQKLILIPHFFVIHYAAQFKFISLFLFFSTNRNILLVYCHVFTCKIIKFEHVLKEKPSNHL